LIKHIVLIGVADVDDFNLSEIFVERHVKLSSTFFDASIISFDLVEKVGVGIVRHILDNLVELAYDILSVTTARGLGDKSLEHPNKICAFSSMKYFQFALWW
jgi:hypothetical protein